MSGKQVKKKNKKKKQKKKKTWPALRYTYLRVDSIQQQLQDGPKQALEYLRQLTAMTDSEGAGRGVQSSPLISTPLTLYLILLFNKSILHLMNVCKIV